MKRKIFLSNYFQQVVNHPLMEFTRAAAGAGDLWAVDQRDLSRLSCNDTDGNRGDAGTREGLAKQTGRSDPFNDALVSKVILPYDVDRTCKDDTDVAGRLALRHAEARKSRQKPCLSNRNGGDNADCTAYAYGDFHNDLIRGRITLIGCPKLDAADYSEKLDSEGDAIEQTLQKSQKGVCAASPCAAGTFSRSQNIDLYLEGLKPFTIGYLPMDVRGANLYFQLIAWFVKIPLFIDKNE